MDEDWKENQKFVLSELERLSEAVEALARAQGKTNITLATLNVKSGIWGLIGGGLSIIIVVGITLLTK